MKKTPTLSERVRTVRLLIQAKQANRVEPATQPSSNGTESTGESMTHSGPPVRLVTLEETSR